MSNEKRLQRRVKELRKELATAKEQRSQVVSQMASVIEKSNEIAKHHQQMVLVLASLALREDDRTIRVTHEEFNKVDQRAKMQTPHEEGVLVFKYDDSEVPEVVQDGIDTVLDAPFDAPTTPAANVPNA